MRETTMEGLEEHLKRALAVLGPATGQNALARKTAARWFNRLYYDLVQWNNEFIQLLRDFPGFKENVRAEDIESYRHRFLEYAYQLDSHGGFGRSESDVCARLNFLAARLEKDFAWLKQADRRAFRQLQDSVGLVQAGPGGFEGISSEIFDTVQRLGGNVVGGWNQETPPVEQARAAIENYIKDSERILGGIRDEANKVGLLLLSVTEYDEALHRDGSLNPQLLVIGEVAVSGDTFQIDNRGGIFNLKSALSNVSQTIATADAVTDSDQRALRALLDELELALEPVGKQAPQNAQRIVSQVETAAKELALPKPDGGFLRITAQGLEHAATTVKNIAPAVIEVAGRIIQFLSKYY